MRSIKRILLALIESHEQAQGSSRLADSLGYLVVGRAKSGAACRIWFTAALIQTVFPGPPY